MSDPRALLEASMEEKEKSAKDRKTAPHSYADCYEPITAWLDDPEIDVNAVLKSYYPSCFKGDKPDFASIKAGLLSDHDSDSFRTAREMFKNLFTIRQRFRNTALFSDPAMETLKRNYGRGIVAHGIEEAKGGLYNLLMMCVSQRIFGEWGFFRDGPPEVSCIPHGPYYLIYTSHKTAASKLPSVFTVQMLEAILLPFTEIKNLFISHLEKMQAVDLLTATQVHEVSAKLFTYEEFLVLLQEQDKENRNPDEQKQAMPAAKSLPFFQHSPAPEGTPMAAHVSPRQEGPPS